MEIKDLEDLKRENANTEIESETVTGGDQLVLDDASNEGELNIDSNALDENESTPEGEGGSEEVESWMVSDEQTSQESEHESGVPVKKHVQVKQKLKAQINEQESELQSLRREIEALKSGKPQQQSTVKAETLPRPKSADYTNEYNEFDSDKFDQALDSWTQKNLEIQQQQSETNQAEQKFKQELEGTVNAHYERAGKLVSDGKVDSADFQSKDLAIRTSLNALQPGKGDELGDWLIGQISLVTKDSEKLWYKLGASKNALDEVIQAFAQPDGNSRGVAKLSELAQTITNPVKRRSAAPKPATQLNGESGSSKLSSADKRKYREAAKKGDYQTSFNLKRAAKKAGVDTSEW